MIAWKNCPLCMQPVEPGAVYCMHCNTFLLPHRRLGEIMIEQGMITDAQLLEGLRKQKKIGQLLVEAGNVNEAQVQQALDLQKQSAAHIAGGVAMRQRIKAAMMAVGVVLLGMLVFAGLRISQIEEEFLTTQAAEGTRAEALRVEGVVLAAIDGLKLEDPRQVEICWKILCRGTGQNLPMDFQAWIDWYTRKIMLVPTAAASGSPAAVPDATDGPPASPAGPAESAPGR